MRMNIDKYMVYIILFINILLLVAGQILWKIGMSKLPSKDLFSIVMSLFTPYVFGGLVLYGFATITWLWIISMSGSSLSVLYPMQSLAYVLFALASILFFQEKVLWTGWLGMGIITFGVFLLTR